MSWIFYFLLTQLFLLLVCYYHTDNIKMKVCSCHSLLKIFQLLSIWFWLIYIFVSLSDFSAHPVISCPITVVSLTFLIISKLFFSKVKLQWFFSLLSTLVLIFLILDPCLLKTDIFWFPSSTNHPFEKFCFYTFPTLLDSLSCPNTQPMLLSLVLAWPLVSTGVLCKQDLVFITVMSWKLAESLL